jgi:hypothetical protein
MHELLGVVPVLDNLTQGDIFEDHPEDDSLLEVVAGHVEKGILRVDDEVEGSRNDVLIRGMKTKKRKLQCCSVRHGEGSC